MTISKRFCFTLNNYTEEEVTAVTNLSSLSLVKYLIFGFEVGENGTEHLQGFIILSKPQRFSWFKSRVPRAHIETAKGTSLQAATYCKKEGNFKEFGVLPANQGKRTDLDRFFEWSDQFTADNGRAPTFEEAAFMEPNIVAKYRRILDVVRARAPAPVIEEGTPMQWQLELEQILNEPADDRSIYFVVDHDGGKGKSWFQKYYFSKYPGVAQLFTFGKRDDTAYMIDENFKVFFFNIPRTAMEHLNYHMLEQIKDRVVQSNKYESRVKIFRHKTHVVVFSNEDPDWTKMSYDRYKLINLNTI